MVTIDLYIPRVHIDEVKLYMCYSKHRGYLTDFPNEHIMRFCRQRACSDNVAGVRLP